MARRLAVRRRHRPQPYPSPEVKRGLASYSRVTTRRFHRTCSSGTTTDQLPESRQETFPPDLFRWDDNWPATSSQTTTNKLATNNGREAGYPWIRYLGEAESSRVLFRSRTELRLITSLGLDRQSTCQSYRTVGYSRRTSRRTAQVMFTVGKSSKGCGCLWVAFLLKRPAATTKQVDLRIGSAPVDITRHMRTMRDGIEILDSVNWRK